jgi:hypothetical protein
MTNMPSPARFIGTAPYPIFSVWCERKDPGGTSGFVKSAGCPLIYFTVTEAVHAAREMSKRNHNPRIRYFGKSL